MRFLICTQNSVITQRFLGKSNHSKWGKYIQCDPRIRNSYQKKKKKSDKILTVWGSWENIHNSRRQMLPWAARRYNRGRREQSIAYNRYSNRARLQLGYLPAGEQNQSTLGQAAAPVLIRVVLSSFSRKQRCVLPSRWQQHHLTVYSL